MRKGLFEEKNVTTENKTIYIGTIGMQGAFEGMSSGDVDVNWLEEKMEKGHVRSGRVAPAE
jgi:hypothetical protein